MGVQVPDEEVSAMETTAPVKLWLASFPEEEAAARIAELEELREAAGREIAALRQLVDIGRAYSKPSGAQQNGDTRPPFVAPAPPQGQEAVEAVMRERPRGKWRASEIEAELQKRGWIADGPRGRRTLGSILHRMVGSGRIKRVGRGTYRLPRTIPMEASTG